MSDLIDTSEACRILGTSKTTLYRYEDAGRLTSVQYVDGGKKRWHREQVEALLGAGPAPAPAPVSEADRRRAERRALRKSA
jgi:excisionase family DNA binding protein